MGPIPQDPRGRRDGYVKSTSLWPSPSRRRPLTLCPEFQQYVFQVLAQLLEVSPRESISDNYKAFLTVILAPALWDVKGNVPGCTRLLSAIIPVTKAYIVSEKLLEQVLGIFQRLLSTKKFQLHGFDILESLVKTFEP